MATLTGQYISQSYGGVINLSTNTGIVTGSFTQLQDGLGTNLGVFFNGQGIISGSAIRAASFTGSLFGTASFANNSTSASYALTATSASYALNATSASYSNNSTSASYSNNSTSASYALNATSASYALTSTSASYALNATSASYAVSTSLAANSILLNGTASSVFAKTGSNTFVGNQIISGSVSNAVKALTISSLTASIDLSSGNLFTLALVNATNTHISASNIQKGQTTSLQITNGTLGSGTVTFSSAFTFPSGSSYIPFASSSAADLISFISFDATKLRAVTQNNFI